MALATKRVEELDFYLKARKQAVREIASESWDPLCVIGLRIAFKKGYEAKQFYDRNKK